LEANSHNRQHGSPSPLVINRITTPNVTTKHTPNTTSIESISIMTITITTIPIITTIMPTINACFQT
jgi:hypothetical protein